MTQSDITLGNLWDFAQLPLKTPKTPAFTSPNRNYQYTPNPFCPVGGIQGQQASATSWQHLEVNYLTQWYHAHFGWSHTFALSLWTISAASMPSCHPEYLVTSLLTTRPETVLGGFRCHVMVMFTTRAMLNAAVCQCQQSKSMLFRKHFFFLLPRHLPLPPPAPPRVLSSSFSPQQILHPKQPVTLLCLLHVCDLCLHDICKLALVSFVLYT